MDIGETVFGMDDEGCQREVIFDEDIHKALVDEMVAGATVAYARDSTLIFRFLSII